MLKQNQKVLHSQIDKLQNTNSLDKKNLKKMKQNETNMKDQIRKLKRKIEDLKKSKEEVDRSRKQFENTFKKKEKSLTTELHKKDSEIETLKSKISAISNSSNGGSFNNTSGKALIKGTEFTVINDHAIKNEFKKMGLYSGASKDFLKFTQTTEQKSYDNLKEENKSLRDALREL